MVIEDQIRRGKLQYDTNREATNIVPWPSVKIDKYTVGEETSPQDEIRMI